MKTRMREYFGVGLGCLGLIVLVVIIFAAVFWVTTYLGRSGDRKKAREEAHLERMQGKVDHILPMLGSDGIRLAGNRKSPYLVWCACQEGDKRRVLAPLKEAAGSPYSSDGYGWEFVDQFRRYGDWREPYAIPAQKAKSLVIIVASVRERKECWRWMKEVKDDGNYRTYVETRTYSPSQPGWTIDGSRKEFKTFQYDVWVLDLATNQFTAHRLFLPRGLPEGDIDYVWDEKEKARIASQIVEWL